jgi:DNA-binding NarL/FixJ family response regulator
MSANSSVKLSAVELELLAYIADGLSNREIARLKNVKIKSCENSISRLAKKLSVRQSPDTNQRVLLAKMFETLKDL